MNFWIFDTQREKKNDIAKVYLLDNLDLNQSLINKKFSKYFRQSLIQNCLVNNNNLISLLNFRKSIENKIQKNIFQDLNHNIFKYYRLNAINFSKQTFFYSEIILVITNALFVKYNTVKSALKKILKEDNGRNRKIKFREWV